MDSYRNRKGCSYDEVLIAISTFNFLSMKTRWLKNKWASLISVNMVAVGIFVGSNIIFIIGFAILFVCQKRILTKAWFPNIGFDDFKLKFSTVLGRDSYYTVLGPYLTVALWFRFFLELLFSQKLARPWYQITRRWWTNGHLLYSRSML